MDDPNDATAVPSARDEAEFHRLTRLQLSCSDFAQARSAATFLLQELKDDVVYGMPAWRKFRCYETTMVVAYARPFSQSKGRVPKLGWKALGVEMSAAELALHDKIVAHRNTLTAIRTPTPSSCGRCISTRCSSTTARR